VVKTLAQLCCKLLTNLTTELERITKMMKLKDLVATLDELLDVSTISDSSPKGLQVEGAAEIYKMVVGVSACMELFERAVSMGAQAILVHHGMFWDSDHKLVRGSLKARLKILLSNDISLLGYHLPLDCHPEVGNNIGLVRALNLIDEKPFGEFNGRSIGYLAQAQRPISIDDFISAVRKKINPDAKCYGLGSGAILKIAICSGGAPSLLREAISVGANVFLTGEESEWIYHLAREEGIYYVAAGHHATERLGPMALAKWINENLDVTSEFVDVSNPI
tara:strand:- start:186319 stop:187152 length:834 start_codon:yes stop_codon:yes gene_type:complete